MRHTEKNINNMSQEFSKVTPKYKELLIQWTTLSLQNEKAKEFATHGFARRTGTLERCMRNIYKICPPERFEKLSEDQREDVTINLQAFIINIFGCLDNLARVWVEEKNITKNNNEPLSPHQIGLGKKCTIIRNSFSSNFRTRLEDLDEWFEHMENFRHALAHRIPLYVPPYAADKEQTAKKRDLEILKMIAIREGNRVEIENLKDEIEKIGTFAPFIRHSRSESSPTALFQALILAGWNTIVEISEKLLIELQSPQPKADK